MVRFVSATLLKAFKSFLVVNTTVKVVLIFAAVINIINKIVLSHVHINTQIISIGRDTISLRKHKNN
jgi:hypothetical protein